MPKDPAVLFYTKEFYGGVAMMPDDQVGRYIKLLCIQHQSGRFTEEQFFMIAKKTDDELLKKFRKDFEGKYYNKKMEKETKRRKKYCASRSKNRKKKDL